MHRRALLRSGAIVGTSLSGLQTAAVPSTAAVSQDDAFEPRGRVSVEGAAETVVGDDGDVAYLAATNGFVTVDVSDPADPTVLAEERRIEVDGGRLTEILDVAVDGDRLVVPGPANQKGDSEIFNGVLVYDVGDPADPVRVAEYETGYHIHNCYLDGDVLYVVANGPGEDDETPDGNRLDVYDVSGDAIEAIGDWSLLDHDPEWGDVFWLARYLHDAYVHDDVAYLPFWNAGTYLLDVSDPADPEYLSHVRRTELEDQRAIEDGREAQQELPGNDHYAAVDDSGTLMAVGREAWATDDNDAGGPGGIDLYDVSDPEAPTHVASIDPPETEDATYRGGEWTTSHNFELRDGHLYSSWYQGGVKIHDVSDPADPVEVVSWEDRETAGFWTARVAAPGETLVASSTQLIPGAGTEGALYTFPIEFGEEEREDDDASDTIPGFAGVAGLAGLAGGVAGLEWVRRRHGGE
ncbi:LVIVD repeat-containing protein [Halosolutus amylolyticus]|uniref:LVIVD repeat-containing protein n=1 Tax=Halosolutus amylolyticus TaxID=2932267 RepID=A0ABD5PQV5_9EURY|nr:hypothetical protein [Halosolutus amylolyticus]